MKYRLLFLVLLFLFLRQPLSAAAQTETPEPTPANSGIPQVHTVQEGENLTYIANLYEIAVADLLTINGLNEESILSVGQTLIIPGGEGSAVPATYAVLAGDSIAYVAARFNTDRAELLQTNRMINPHYQLVAGQTLTVISRTGTAVPQPPDSITGIPHIVRPGESLALVAARYGRAPVAIAAANDLPYPTYLFVGQRLRIPAEIPYRPLSGEWLNVQISPLPITRGSTAAITVANKLDGTPTGRFANLPLLFAPTENGYTALVGLDAFTAPGPHLLELSGSGLQPWRPFQQEILVAAGDYALQQIEVTAELAGLLDPDVRANEDKGLEPLYLTFTPEKYWDGPFSQPVTEPFVTARYGDSRSYNGGPVEIFHTGVDFGGGVGVPILAPAAGVVVFNDTLELRGLTVIIDHGRGVMTAYNHLSETFVETGAAVSSGQPIGAMGNSGLSTGAHLHWELRILNVPVNGLQWTETTFP